MSRFKTSIMTIAKAAVPKQRPGHGGRPVRRLPATAVPDRRRSCRRPTARSRPTEMPTDRSVVPSHSRPRRLDVGEPTDLGPERPADCAWRHAIRKKTAEEQDYLPWRRGEDERSRPRTEAVRLAAGRPSSRRDVFVIVTRQNRRVGPSPRRERRYRMLLMFIKVHV